MGDFDVNSWQIRGFLRVFLSDFENLFRNSPTDTLLISFIYSKNGREKCTVCGADLSGKFFCGGVRFGLVDGDSFWWG
jgi:hypothetical protein